MEEEQLSEEEQRLFDEIDGLFNRLKKDYSGKRRKHRTWFINAHFESVYAYDDLTFDQKVQLFVFIKNRVERRDHRCCNRHNEFHNLHKNRRAAMFRKSWYKPLKARMDAGLEKCVRCSATNNLTLDHIIPIAKGGKSRRDNVQIMCLPCNMAKGDSILTPELSVAA